MNVITFTDERIRTLLPMHLLTAGQEHKQEPRVRPWGADFYQLLYVARGSGVFESPKGCIPITEGMTVFTAKACPSAYRGATEDFYTSWVTFDGPQVKTLLEYFSAEEVAVLKSEAVKAQMFETYKCAERNLPAEMLSGSLFQILVTFFGELNEGKKPPKLVSAKEYIGENYAKDLSVSDIAESVGISESLLYRIFRNAENTTPIAFLRSVRIRKAKELLLETDARIAEIAVRTGFFDAAYFCKVFKAETGMTPWTFRTRLAL